MNRFAIASLALVLGCKDNSTPPPECVPGVDAACSCADGTAPPCDTETGDTDDGGLTMTPGSFGVGVAEFAIDDQGNARSFSAFDQAGNPVQGQVALSVLILDESVTAAINESNSCQITLGVAGPVAPDGAGTWTETAGVNWGFHLPAGTPVVGNTCQNFTFPAAWGDVVSKVQQWDWGFALNEMDPTVLPQLEAGFGANWAAIEGSVVGAGWYSNVLDGNPNTPGGYADGGFAIGSQVDASFVYQTDGAGNPLLLTSQEVWFAGATLPGVAAYSAQGVIYLQPADFLLGAVQ